MRIRYVFLCTFLMLIFTNSCSKNTNTSNSSTKNGTFTIGSNTYNNLTISKYGSSPSFNIVADANLNSSEWSHVRFSFNMAYPPASGNYTNGKLVSFEEAIQKSATAVYLPKVNDTNVKITIESANGKITKISIPPIWMHNNKKANDSVKVSATNISE